MQETFQQYKRNENIPEFPDGEEDDTRQKELESVSVQENEEKQNLLSEESHWK